MLVTHKFGTPTITEAALRLAEHEAAHGPAVVVFNDPRYARPYDEILHRQLDIENWKQQALAVDTTYEWPASDLETFAAAHPNGPRSSCRRRETQR
jgi:hypothetical protein